MKAAGKIGLAGIDTRALTRHIRRQGAPNAVIAYEPNGGFDLDGLLTKAREWPGLEGMDLARRVSREKQESWEGGYWRLGTGYGRSPRDESRPHVVAIDYGSKDNIFRNLVKAGARVTVVPAKTSLEDILACGRTGCSFNGPGDPATGNMLCRSSRRCWSGRAAVRHLPRPPDAGAGGGREDDKMHRATAARTNGPACGEGGATSVSSRSA